MKTKLLALALLAGSSAFAGTHFSIGVGIGGYAPGGYYAAPPQVVIPPCPGPGYTWIDGYWASNGAWINGYWRAPFFSGFAPRHTDRRYDDRYYERRYDRDFDRGWDQSRGRDRAFDRGRDNRDDRGRGHDADRGHGFRGR